MAGDGGQCAAGQREGRGLVTGLDELDIAAAYQVKVQAGVVRQEGGLQSCDAGEDGRGSSFL